MTGGPHHAAQAAGDDHRAAARASSCPTSSAHSRMRCASGPRGSPSPITATWAARGRGLPGSSVPAAREPAEGQPSVAVARIRTGPGHARPDAPGYSTSRSTLSSYPAGTGTVQDDRGHGEATIPVGAGQGQVRPEGRRCLGSPTALPDLHRQLGQPPRSIGEAVPQDSNVAPRRERSQATGRNREGRVVDRDPGHRAARAGTRPARWSQERPASGATLRLDQAQLVEGGIGGLGPQRVNRDRQLAPQHSPSGTPTKQRQHSSISGFGPRGEPRVDDRDQLAQTAGSADSCSGAGRRS